MPVTLCVMTDVAGSQDTDEQALLDCLPEDGATKGNQAVRKQLGWDEDRYFAVRDRLEDEGIVLRGQGCGGTVRRNLTPVPPVVFTGTAPAGGAELSADTEATNHNELRLYEPMRRVIAGQWAKDHRADPVVVEITAQQGRRATGGTWSRPDITSVEVRTFSYVPASTWRL